MNTLGGVLELRMRRSWRLFISLCVPAFAALIVTFAVVVLSGPESGLGGLMVVGLVALILGGLIVVPGTLLLIRLARGVPDVRIDQHGIVWGSDRVRDLALTWPDVDTVAIKLLKSQYVTDRLFVIRPRTDATPRPPLTLYGRFTSITNRVTSGSRYAISTSFADQRWEVIRATIERHLGRPVDPT